MKRKLFISVFLTALLSLLLSACTVTPGADGKDGKSAYEIAVQNGFQGTEKEWLSSLKGTDGQKGADGQKGTNGANGTDGKNGTDGASAYAVAVKNGFQGTEKEWLSSLKGTNGLSVISASIDGDGHLILTMSDGSTLDTGYLPTVCPHTPVTDPPVAATCRGGGLTEGSHCSQCSAVLKAQRSTERLPHRYTAEMVTPATCTENGTRRYTCAGCGDTYTEAVPHASYTASEIYELAAPTLAEITVYDADGAAIGLGSGFVYTADGEIVTNYHVIEGAHSASVFVNGRAYDVISVLGYDIPADLAILKIDAEQLPLLPVCTQPIKAGKEIFAFGAPRGYSATLSRGIITYSMREVQGVIHIQHDASLSPGNSGGPLINEYGEIIGVNTWQRSDGDDLNFAVFVSEIEKLPRQSMTLTEVFITEHTAFSLVKNKIMKNGSLQSGAYILPIKNHTSGGYTYYYTADVTQEAELRLTLLISAADTQILTSLFLNAADTSCRWELQTGYGDRICGVLDANSFTGSELLPFTSYTGLSPEPSTSLRELVSSTLQLICLNIDACFTDIGVGRAQFGFIMVA